MTISPLIQTPTQRIEALLNAEPPDFSALADAFMGLGMAAESALCHGWSLLTPGEELWRPAVQLWTERIADRAPLAQPQTPAPSIADRQEAAMEIELKAIQALLEGGDAAAACARITRLSHNSNLPPHLCNRAAMLHTTVGDFWEAERWYRTSLVQQPAQVQPWLALASVLLRQGAFDEALEAAGIGLQQHPDHPWGLKLRQHSLEGLQASSTLRHLADRGELPFGLPGSQDAAPPPPSPGPTWPLTLQQKLRLQRLLAGDRCHIWCLGPGAHRILLDLASQRLLPEQTRVQVFADPDADLQHPDDRQGITFEPSRPAYVIRHQDSIPHLAIVTTISSQACPLITGQVIAQAAPLLIERSLDLQPHHHQVAFATEGWVLWLPTPAS